MALKVGELYASFGIDSSGIDSALKDFEKQCNDIAADLGKTGAILSGSLTAPVIAFGKEVFQVGSDFEAQMSRVQAISDATDTQLKALTQTAKELGASSSFSASQAAEGMEYLASAGFTVEEIMKAMPGMLNLAASSGEDLGTSADIAASVLRGFGLAAGDAAHVADVLAKNAADTNAAVYDTGEAMKYVAPLANTMGHSLEEVAAAIGLMSNAGIKGGQAGTTLRGALSRLAKPTEIMQVTMDELGLSFYDSEGKMKSLAGIISMLQTNMTGLTDEQKQNALVTLFGQEALSGMMVLLEAGPDALADLTAAYEECDGAAAGMAETMLNNLSGAVEEFGGAVETAQINIYDRFNPAMTDAVKSATALVNEFNLMDDATKDVIYKVVGLGAATGPALLGMSGIVATAGKLLPIMSALVSPIGVVGLGIGMLGVAAVDAENDIGKAFNRISGDIKLTLKKSELSMKRTFKEISGRVPALSKSIISGLNNIIPAVIDLGSETASSLLDAIADNSDVLADIGMTIVTDIADGVSRNLPKLAVSGVNIVTRIATSLISNAPELFRSAGSLAKGIVQAFSTVDWLDVGSQIITSIGEAGKDIADIIVGWKDDAKRAVEEAGGFKAVGLSIIEDIKKGFQTAGGWLKTAIMGEAETEATWADVGQVILTGIQNGLSGIGSWISEKIDEGRALAANIDWSSIWANISTTADSLKNKAYGIADNIVTWIGEKLGTINGENLASTLGDLSAVATGIIDSIINSKVDFVSKGGELLGKLIDGVGKFDGWSAVGSTFTTIADGLIKGVVSGIDSLGNVSVLILGKIGNLLSSEGVSTALGSLSGVATGIVTSIADSIPSLTTTASKIIVAISDTIDAIPWSTVAGELSDLALGLLDGVILGLENLGTDGFDDIIEAIGKGIVSVASGLGTAAGTVVGKFVSYITTPENLLKVGEVAGIWVGEIVKGMFSLGGTMFESAARFLTNTLVGTMRGIFGAEVDPYVERLMQDFLGGEFEVPVDTFDGMGRVCGTALYEAMLSPFANTESLENAITAWGIAVQNGYSSIIPEFAFLGSESIRTLSAAMLAGIESNSQDMQTTTEQAALLVATGYAEGLIGGFYVNKPGIYDAMSALLDENTIDLSTLAATHGYDIGSLMGVSIPEGYSFALKNGYFAITDATGQFIYEAERTIEDGWTIDSVMAALWEAAMNESFAVITGDRRSDLINELKELGVDAGSILGLALPGGIASGLAAGEIDVKEAAKQIAEAAQLAKPEVEAAIAENKDKYGQIAQGGADGLTAKETVVETAATTVSTTVTEAFEPVPTELSTIGTEAMTSLTTALTDGQEGLTASASVVSKAAADQFGLNLSAEQGTALGAGWITSISSGMYACSTTLEDTSSSMGESAYNLFKGWLSNGRGLAQGTDFMAGIQSGLAGMFSGISSTASSIAQSVYNTFSGIMSMSAGKSLGYNFDAGIAQGIYNGSGLITSAAKSAANAALAAAKNALDIHSPSGRAEKEVGYMFDEGAAKGVLGNMGVIIAASNELGKEMLDAMLVGDPSHGTVLSSKSAAREAAAQTAQANGNQSDDNAERIGRAMADRLIESGVLDGDILMDGEKVGEKVSGPVSKNISRKSKTTITGRAALAMR